MSLEKLYKAIDGRTKGEWTVPGDGDSSDDIIRVDGERICGACCCGGITENDGEFVAMMGTHGDRLADVLAQAMSLRDAYREGKFLDSYVACLVSDLDKLEAAVQ